ncbi:MAG: AMP-binding protein [Desulfobacteraceae bacterium]|nr:AMP-binding protein [Desulfobacteraceae bacterium]
MTMEKVLEIKDQLPLLKKVIYWDPQGLWEYDDPDLLSITEVMEMGREYCQETPGLFDDRVDHGNGDDIAVLFYTSGTTGLPKGAMLLKHGSES